MRHHSKIKKFGRKKDQRKALLKTLGVSLIRYGKIKTTEAKAKALRPFIEKLITIAKKQTLASNKLLISRLGDNASTKKLYKEVWQTFKNTNGGYTRIIKLPKRLKDASSMAIIEIVK